jgi:hypothetical protein
MYNWEKINGILIIYISRLTEKSYCYEFFELTDLRNNEKRENMLRFAPSSHAKRDGAKCAH